MTDEELEAIEATFMDDFTDRDDLRRYFGKVVVEVRRIARAACFSGQAAVVAKMADLLDANGFREASDLVRRAWLAAQQ